MDLLEIQQILSFVFVFSPLKPMFSLFRLHGNVFHFLWTLDLPYLNQLGKMYYWRLVFWV